jgi:meso-butanediol dehydrogenase / (S,S)-butanediol dehydrogenase / diacetyl reductase
MGRLENKVAVITGTGNGMGRTAALRFAQEGAKIVGCDVNEDTAAETLKLVRDAGGQMECLFPLDLTIESEAKRLMEHAAATFGRIDVLYNNAMGMMAGYPRQMTLQGFDYTIKNTLTLGWLATKHAVPHMRSGGSIVFIGSQGGLTNSGGAFPGNVPMTFAYFIAKAGVIRMSALFATDLAELGIRVNCICPGPINTPIAGPMYGTPESPMYQPFVDQLLTDRIGEPMDIVNMALYLASDEAGYTTASTLVVDGGFTGSGGVGRPKAEFLKQMQQPPFVDWFNHDPQ